MRNNISFLKLASVFIAFVSILLFVSCDKKQDEIITNGNEKKLVFTVASIEDPKEINVKLGSNKSIQSQDPVILTHKLGNDIELESISSKGSMEDILSNSAVSDLKSKIDNKLASTTPMEVGKKYRILIYNKATNVLLYNEVATAGTGLIINVFDNIQYKWIAYSYNDATNVPALNNPANPTIQTTTNSDLLYDQGEILTVTNNLAVPITFEHKVAKITIELFAHMLDGELQTMNVELVNSDNNVNTPNNYFNTATIDLMTGNMVPGSKVDFPVSAATFLPVDPNNPTSRFANFYTAVPSNLTEIKINITQLTSKNFSDQQIRTLVPSVQTGNAPLPVKFTFASPQVGDNLIGTFRVLSTISSMGIMYADTSNALNNYNHVGMPYNIPSNYQGFISNMNNRGYWVYASGFLGTNFAPASDYTTHKVKTTGYLTLSGRLNEKMGDLDAQLGGGLTPDVIIISNSAFLPNKTGDMDKLISYVDRGGVVILMIDGGWTGAQASAELKRHKQFDRFVKHVFGSNTEMVEMEDHVNVTTVPQTPYLGVFANYNYHGVRSVFKMNSSINDPITNGFYGNLKNANWGSVYKRTLYVTGMDAGTYVNYSVPKPINNTTAANYVLPSDASVMLKSKTKNVFLVGDAEFINSNPNVDYPYRVLGAVSGNYPKNYPVTVTNFVNGYSVDNAKLFGNIMIWALVQAKYAGINTP